MRGGGKRFTDAEIRAIRADPRTCKDIARDPRWWCNEDTIYRIKRRATYQKVSDVA